MSPLRLPFAALLTGLLSAPAAAAAPPGSVEACLESAALQPRTAFDVVVSSYPTLVERRLDIQQIGRLRLAKLPAGVFAHGVSVADYRLNYVVKSEATCWKPGGRACAWLGSVVVDLTPADIRIYIPKEYRPSSCEAKQLLKHEMGHERLHRAELLKAAERMRSALARAKDLPGPLTPINASSPQEAYARLKKMVDAVVRPIYEDFLKDIEKKQEGLDDPGEYRRLGEACPGWVKT